MKKIIIFGLEDTAQLAKYYIDNDTNDVVVGFCVNKSYKTEDTFEGLPVYEFESITEKFAPEDYYMFAPMTGAKMNALRKKVYIECKNKGYQMYSYISSKATVFTDQIGDNCFILENNIIQPFVSIGNNVVLWSGNHIGHHGVIEDHVFFSAYVVIGGHCVIGESAWVGINATIKDRCKIASKTLIGIGAMITKDTQENGFYLGSPARKLPQQSVEVDLS